MRKALWRAAILSTIPVAYHLFKWSVDAVRAHAGVGADTGTVLDMVAWVFAVGVAASAAGGITGIRLFRRTWLTYFVPPFILVMTVVQDLAAIGSLGLHLPVMSDLLLVYGSFTLPAIFWSMCAGYYVGYIGSRGTDARTTTLRIVCLITILLLGLILVFYPAEAYFVRLYG